MKVYVIAGEVSGDQHAAAFVQKLKLDNVDPILLRGIGGTNLEKEGVEIYKHFQEFAVMGFTEVLSKIFTFKKLINQIVDDIIQFAPDKLLLVDSSGLNMQIAKQIKRRSNIYIQYYIAPKIWAWGEWRAKNIKKFVDELLCILPFEVNYFKNKGIENVKYLKNPTLAAIQNYTFKDIQVAKSANILALLPGSRKQEISHILPTMLAAVNQLKDMQIVIAAAPNIADEFYEQYIKNTAVIMLRNQTWDLLNVAEFAIVTSGTATLETAIIGCPQVVVYKTSALNYFLGKMLIKVKYISLVNLILDKEAVPELIQNECNETSILKAINEKLTAQKKYQSELIDILSLD